jgi:peptidyl-prolyl cis-trans isomerase SurA
MKLNSGNNFKNLSVGFVSVLLFFQIIGPGLSQSVQKIVALVNDEPISGYDVDQRIQIMLLNSRELRSQLNSTMKSKATSDRFRKMMIAAQPRSKDEALEIRNRFIKQIRRDVTNSMRSKFKGKALEELIDEKLMMQDAKKSNITVSNEELDQFVTNMAKSNKNPKTGKPLSKEQFLDGLRQTGVSEKAFKERIRANIALRRVVSQKYGRQIFVGEQQVDRLLAESDDSSIEKTTEFQLQKLSIPLPKNAGQSEIAQRLLEADNIRSRFKSCSKSKELNNTIKGLRIQSLGRRTADQIAQPTRSYVMAANVGQLTPPDVNNNGIVLYAVCAKRQVAGNQQKRREVQNELRQQEFAVLRKRHLRNLRQDAFVEYR